MRALVVLLAYLCASIAAIVPIFVVGWIAEGLAGPWRLRETVFMSGVLVLMAATYALPVSVPVIAFTEYRKVGNWPWFAVAGMVLGLLLAFLFTGVPYRGIDFRTSASMVVSAVSGAMTYWMVAWRIFPPKRSSWSMSITRQGKAA
ncbi:MAG: hypothetical protein IE933_01425 [Sphingomonadales bacterium]|nr:hypothetical protein [Sphingomonadales bacterium]MBD3771982.1 hypothetical protein [Paracoccaceae bacterium]MBD3814049.1 hypothetical protein [Betaproteobacteria bacterium]